MPRIFVDQIITAKPGEVLSAKLSFCRFTDIEDKVAGTLHPEELRYYRTLRFEARQRSYLLGRYSAKIALSSLVNEENLNEILISQGCFGQPVIARLRKQNVQVSITHCGEIGAAIAFPETHPMAIDIEGVRAAKDLFDLPLADNEKTIINNIRFSHLEKITLLWTVKESLSKILKTGLTVPLPIYEINEAQQEGDFVISTFKNFEQYKSVSFSVADCICSLTCPRRTDVHIDIRKLQQSLEPAQTKVLDNLV